MLIGRLPSSETTASSSLWCTHRVLLSIYSFLISSAASWTIFVAYLPSFSLLLCNSCIFRSVSTFEQPSIQAMDPCSWPIMCTRKLEKVCGGLIVVFVDIKVLFRFCVSEASVTTEGCPFDKVAA